MEADHITASKVDTVDAIVKDGTVVTPTDIFMADIGIENGKIVQISQMISDQADKVIDASGKFVLPGVIDAHTHMDHSFMDTTSADSFEIGSIAAACGGVTTYLSFAYQSKGGSLLDAIEERRKKADSETSVDYSLHVAIKDPREDTISEIPEIVQYGVPSFKLYMAYRKEGRMVDDATLLKVLLETRKCGAVVCLHAEDGSIIENLTERFLNEGKTSAEYHARSRPDFVEAEAINRAIDINRQARGSLYIVHVSTLLGRRAIKDAVYDGLNVYGETCPHYLTFTDEKYLGNDGLNYVMSPPLRKKDDINELWLGIAQGDIKTVGSDHCPFRQDQKLLGKKNFTLIPNGIPGVETLLPILFSEGVRKNRISLNRLAQVTSYNPARIFGLYPRKGSMTIGSDADIVIIDPEKRVKLSHETLHSNVDFSPYHGLTVRGYPIATLLRGEPVYIEGEYVGKRGRGLFLKRGKSRDLCC